MRFTRRKEDDDERVIWEVGGRGGVQGGRGGGTGDLMGVGGRGGVQGGRGGGTGILWVSEVELEFKEEEQVVLSIGGRGGVQGGRGGGTGHFECVGGRGGVQGRRRRRRRMNIFWLCWRLAVEF